MSDVSSALQELLNSAISSEMNNMYTAIPCVVVNVRESLAGQMVDIQPTLNQKMKDGTIAERPPILGVPVIFPASRLAALTFPINKGDTGLAVFSMRNLDGWKSGTGLPTTPLNQAKFDKGDAIFIPGLQTPSQAVNNPQKRVWQHSTQDTVLATNIGTATEVEIRLKNNGNVIINSRGKVEINCDTAEVVADTQASLFTPLLNIQATQTVWSGNITLNGNLTTTGVMSYNGVNFATHVHGNSPGPSNP